MADNAGEYEHTAHALYLSDEFVDQAPTDKGLVDLRDYFDEKLEADALNGMRDRELGFFSIESLPPSAQEKIKKLVDDKGKMVATVLKMYANFSCSSLTTSNEDRRKRFVAVKLGVKTVGGYLNFNLSMDMAAIDHLVEKANSIPTYGSETIEGQARLVSSTPPNEE